MIFKARPHLNTNQMKWPGATISQMPGPISVALKLESVMCSPF